MPEKRGGNWWSLRQEEDDKHRRMLLLQARKGDLKAQNELMEKYGMRVYSDTERSKMPTYYDSGKKGSPPSLKSKSTSAPTAGNRSASQGNVNQKQVKTQKGKI
jgi:hypothetical protein